MKQKNKKVYLQYPWAFPDSPYYKYLVENPPQDFEYINAKNQKGVITNKRKFWFSNSLKRNIRRLISYLNFPIINAHKSPKGNYDLIHCAHCLSKNQNKPWVADLEGYWSVFIGSHMNKFAKKRALNIMNQSSCKKILPWTEHTKQEIIKVFPQIKEKLEVVYPAIPLNYKKRKTIKNKKITILYATRYFWLKGGIIALEVYKKLQEKYKDKIELIFISDVPEEIKKRYPTLNISGLVPSEKMQELYKKSDIFFYPSFVDTFGFGLLEAMSYGLPIICVDSWGTPSRKEIIENNKHGLIFNIDEKEIKKLTKQKEKLIIGFEEQKIINQLFENCSKLINNKKLREKISKNCIEEIKNGKFSIKQRNKKLKKIYENAMR